MTLTNIGLIIASILSTTITLIFVPDGTYKYLKKEPRKIINYIKGIILQFISMPLIALAFETIDIGFKYNLFDDSFITSIVIFIIVIEFLFYFFVLLQSIDNFISIKE